MNPFSNILAQTSGTLNRCNDSIVNKENDNNINTKKVTTNTKPTRKSSIIPSTPSTAKKNKVGTATKAPKSALKSNIKQPNIIKSRRNLTPENEVIVLIARLKQLVGDFNDSIILEKLQANGSNSDSAALFRSPTRVAFNDIDKNIDVVISPNISNLKSNSNSNDDNDNLISYFMDTNDYEIDNDMSVNVKYSNRVSEIAPIRSWQTRY